MGYRGKLMVEHTEIKLPKEIAEKYKDVTTLLFLYLTLALTLQ